MTLLKYSEKNIGDIQKEIETELDLSLGNIKIFSIEDLVEQILDLGDSIKGALRKKIRKSHLEKLSNNSGGFHPKFPRNLYFNQNTSYEDKDLSNEIVKALYYKHLVHELGHLSHFKILGKEKYKILSSDISEGFACYLSEKLTNNKFNFKLPPENSSYRYSREFLKQEFKRNRVKTPEEIKRFLENNLSFDD